MATLAASNIPTITVDGNYYATVDHYWVGGAGAVFVNGTFGGGTVTLQYCPVDSATAGDWVTVGTSTTFTVNGLGGFTLPRGFVRLNMASSTTPSVFYKIGAVGIGNRPE